MLALLRQNRAVRQVTIFVGIIVVLWLLVELLIWDNARERAAYLNTPEGKAETARNAIHDQDQQLLGVAETLAKVQLRDPDSAQFADSVVRKNGGVAVCGAVNSRNSFGGMSGYQSFVYTEKDGVQFVGESDRAAHLADRYCF